MLGIDMAMYVLVGILIALVNVVACEKIVVCYYGTWATYRWGYGKFDVDNVNTDLCTHLIYTFVGIDTQGTVISLDTWLDLPGGKDNFRKFNALKDKNPNLKTILAVGGWNEGSGKYSVMAANPTFRKNFITSALQMVQQYGFDGFDLDWEYPNRRDTVFGQADIDNFTQLLKEMKEEFVKHGLLLTAAVSSVGEMASLSYDISAISNYLDFISIMSYDMYGAWDPVTGHNAPLHKGEGDEAANRESLYTVDVAVEFWLKQGCPPEKLVLGLPLYGRTFTLTDANNHKVRAPSSGAGIAGPYTVTSGSIGYNEFCEKLKTESWTVYRDSSAEVPYAVQNLNWVSYDDPESLTRKVEYALENNLAGAMVWSIETDDFNGLCSGEDFPLLRAINRALGRLDGSSVTSSSTTASTTSSTAESTTTTAAPTTSSTAALTTTTTASPTTTVASTTTASTSVATTEKAATTESLNNGESESGSVCVKEGYASSPDNCSVFYVCARDVNGEFVAYEFECPAGTQWDHDNRFCNYDYDVNCSV